MNPLPPQAYTKDTLLKAYTWLTTQGPSIKEMATTPDILVSLYLKAIRDGDSSLDRPSIQNFKNELKSLAGLMGQLDNKNPGSASNSPQQAPAGASYSAPSSSSQPHHEAPRAPTPPTSMTGMGLNGLGLDSLSLSMIHEVKTDLNLSSEIEALRMLIKIGHTRAKNLL
jgi:hypothetical protein